MSNARNLSKLLGTSTTVPASNMADGSLIELHTVSLGVAASEIAFNSTYITTTYDDYLMIGKSVTPATDGAEPIIQISVDNGSNFVAIASTISVPADATLSLLENPIYLDETDLLYFTASAANDLTYFVSYEELDDA